MVRWYVTGPTAVAAALVGATVHPLGLILGPLLVMMPVWVYRSRGSRTAERQIQQMAYEMQDSVQATFAIASGLLFALLILTETVFSSSGQLLGVIAEQASGVPLPLAYIATTALGWVGLDAGSVTAAQFAGFALIAFAIAYAVREVRD